MHRDRIRLAVNAVSLLSPFTGIASYVYHLMGALSATGAISQKYFYGFAWSDHLRQRAMPGLVPAKRLVWKMIPRAHELNRLAQSFLFRREAVPSRFHLYHEPNFLLFPTRLPAVVTVHDLVFLRYPETHPAARVRILSRNLPRSLERARYVISVSRSVRDELLGMFSISPEKVVAIHNGVSDQYKPRGETETAEVLGRFGVRHGRYLLSVGTLEPRKNLRRVLRAYATLPERLRQSFPLVIAGMQGWGEQPTAEMRALVSRGQVRVLAYVGNRDISFIYAGAAATVYASIYEGFGLPIVEAMASGVPVITSHSGSMAEVAGDAALLVDPLDENSIASGMRRVLEDPSERLRLAKAGLARAAAFSWENCAAETLRVYRSALEQG